MLEGVAVVEADRWGDAMQTWSFPELGGVPLDRCGLGEADDSYGVLRFWSVGPLCYYCFPEKVGKALEFTNAAAFALVFSSRERHPARALALMRECLVPAYREGGPMKLLQAFLTLQTSGASPGGATNYLAFAADKGGAPPGTTELVVEAPDDDDVGRAN